MTIDMKSSGTGAKNIMAVDDEETILKLYQKILSEEGHKVVLAASGKEAMDILEHKTFDLIFLDLKLPDMDGIEILKRIREKMEWTPVIIVTANPSLETSIEAIRVGGVYEYAVKPFNSENLRLSIRRAIEKSELFIQNKRLLRKVEIANLALTERVDELEKIANTALEYEKKIEQLEKRIKELEQKT